MGQVGTSYTVFTHLLDASEKVRGQHDGIPVGGNSPTTSWADGEVIKDVHDIVLSADSPPGDYAIEIGLYDANTGERLPVADAKGQAMGNRVVITGVSAVGP